METNRDEIVGRRVFEALANVKEAFRNHSVEVRRLKSVLKTLQAVEVIKYESGSILEGYSEAELSDGTTLSWLLDVNWTENSWTIETKLARSRNSEQDTVHELPAIKVDTLDEFLERLLATTHRLLGLRPPGL
jgi:hypothetical protein